MIFQVVIHALKRTEWREKFLVLVLAAASHGHSLNLSLTSTHLLEVVTTCVSENRTAGLLCVIAGIVVQLIS